MGIWGFGFLESDDDLDMAAELGEMLGCELLVPPEKEKAAIISKLSNGVLSKCFDRMLDAAFRPKTEYYARSRLIMLLGILAMRLGATIEEHHIRAMKVLRPQLPTLYLQIQLATALAQYKNNGTPWVLGSALFDDFKNSDWKFQGYGHSEDEKPFAEEYIKRCLTCENDEGALLRCSRCNVARYCNKECQRQDWRLHQGVCKPGFELSDRFAEPEAKELTSSDKVAANE
ncbi:uncharacterized protein BCR38DRAFT_408232 [Pseudomassariella vexata]|uniref:MYND-type domain-containing protein n=1 Tax=Pseudomassariella vexata TaxID=1141098 RepID=A0A1Y2E4B3_9PEZI|nr:uncharacterized protein BCR38DRAFT_408232 [Pseudomassariella vexata]ORY66277.1 hypothetical protein BCR38DRAFT_408232 [Pseudomassariella vexata]